MNASLAGRRVLVTRSTELMGPALCEVLAEGRRDRDRERGALAPVDAAARVVAGAGAIDVLIANLSIAAPTTRALDLDEPEWRDAFASPRRSAPEPREGGAPRDDRARVREDPGDG